MPSQLSDISGSFAQRLRALMEAQRIGAPRLAALARVDQRQINRYRSGQVEPRDSWGWPTPNALKLARALGVDVDELLPPRETKDAA